MMSTLARRSLLVLALLFGLLFAVGTAVIWRMALPLWVALLFALAVVALQFAIGPAIVELIYKIRWTPPDAVNPHFAQWYRDACARRGIPPPRFGVIEDGKPNAFTFGHTPADARIVVTTGLLNMLTPAEVHAVVAHEMGHVANRDFIVMTIASTVPLALYICYVWTRSFRGDRNLFGWAVAAGAYVAYIVSQYLVLLLSRVREYFADEVSAYTTGDANALSSALVKIAYGLAAPDAASTPATSPAHAAGSVKSRGLPSPAGAMAVLGIASPAASGMFAMSATNAAGQFSPHLMARVMQWDLKNPWARWFELNATHPLTARRIHAMNATARKMGQVPFFDVNPPEFRAAIYSGPFWLELFMLAAPFLGAVAGGLAGHAFMHARYDMGAVGIAIVGWCAGLLIQKAHSYPRIDPAALAPLCVEQLVSDVNVSHITPITCVLDGVIIGRGVPGLFCSPDLVLQDQTGFVTLQYRQPLGILDFLFGWLESGEYVGKPARVYGWYRRGPGPVVEISRVEVAGWKSLRCHYAAGIVIGALLFMAVGLALPFLIR